MRHVNTTHDDSEDEPSFEAVSYNCHVKTFEMTYWHAPNRLNSRHKSHAPLFASVAQLPYR